MGRDSASPAAKTGGKDKDPAKVRGARKEASTAAGSVADGVQWGVWHSLGPFVAPKGQEVFPLSFPPEEKVDLTVLYDDGALRWQEHPEWDDGVVQSLKAPSQAATYLFRTIEANAAAKANAYFGSDDGLTVWLNGEKIVSHDAARGAAPDQDTAVLDLRAGENQLLLKISNHGGNHGFYFSTNPNAAKSASKTKRADAGKTVASAKAATSAEKKAADKKVAKEARAKGEADAKAKPVANAAEALDFEALALAIGDLTSTYGEAYPRGAAFAERLAVLRSSHEAATKAQAAGDASAAEAITRIAADYQALKREALVQANPLLDFDRLLVVKRPANAPKLGLPQNWQGNCVLPAKGFDDEIDVLSPLRSDAQLTTFFHPGGKFVGDVDLHFDGDRMLFSSTGDNGRWQVFEIRADGTGLRQVTPGDQPDVDNYDGCYLPDGRILFDSTAPMVGVPCVGGKVAVANLYQLGLDDKVRQLCFEQDHDWCPTVLNSGRVLYTRWEYGDQCHYFTRLLMSMNPDGTEQAEYYHSNSYWPNSTFYARPIPGHPTKVVAVISGHHGVARMGELVVFDPAQGRREAEGAVQRIPGRGQPVEPVIADQLVANSWPKFLHPFPLSDKYFLVSCKPTPQSNWGIYLVDVFDNMTLLREEPKYALFEPIPLRKTSKPPAIPDRVKPDQKDALVYLVDVYRGEGMNGVPRGAVKSLRLFEWHYAYQNIGGHNVCGVECGWEPKRILGTVPVESDGSALFRVPANTPIAVQPLDEKGRAIQLMRSWMTAMPGETLSCVGCHERQNTTPPMVRTIAATRPPSDIEPWRGPARGFSFVREVQPVLERSCVACHNGQPQSDGRTIPNFADAGKGEGGFHKSYLALQPFVRRPGPESDYHLFRPYEYHASTSELVQMLEKGHQGVQLDDEGWDRLVTWIDLNAPDFGAWSEAYGEAKVAPQHERRLELRALYANVDVDPEALPDAAAQPAPQSAAIVAKADAPVSVQTVALAGWPFDAGEAKSRQTAIGAETRRTVDLGDGVTMDLVRIPAGEFVMGDPAGEPDERPAQRVRIETPFWMGACEVTNEQYRRFDPSHDSRFYDQQWKDHTTPGYPANGPKQPVVRVTWNEARAFCRWLSEKTGASVDLPNEAQWEYACRAGAATPFWYGDVDTDFSPFANLADQSIRLFAVKGINPQPIPKPTIREDFLPRDARFNDNAQLAVDVGRYQPNPWGLCDMHGNVWEWTRSPFRSYPWKPAAEEEGTDGRKVVRGGSFLDRPERARASFRIGYEPQQPVFNVGFRVMCDSASAPPSEGKPQTVAYVAGAGQANR